MLKENQCVKVRTHAIGQLTDKHNAWGTSVSPTPMQVRFGSRVKIQANLDGIQIVADIQEAYVPTRRVMQEATSGTRRARLSIMSHMNELWRRLP